MYAAPRTAARRSPGCVRPYGDPLVANRAVDLLRVSSALCTAPGRARCRGWRSFPAPAFLTNTALAVSRCPPSPRCPCVASYRR